MIEGNRCPEDYPRFKDGGLHGNLLVDEGVYVVERNGRVCITTTSNKWEGASESVKQLNQGYVRARFLTNQGDFLTYSNQIRLASNDEVSMTKKWVKSHQLPYKLKENGQFSLF